jgi:hypothetical protein
MQNGCMLNVMTLGTAELGLPFSSFAGLSLNEPFLSKLHVFMVADF